MVVKTKKTKEKNLRPILPTAVTDYPAGFSFFLVFFLFYVPIAYNRRNSIPDVQQRKSDQTKTQSAR